MTPEAYKKIPGFLAGKSPVCGSMVILGERVFTCYLIEGHGGKHEVILQWS